MGEKLGIFISSIRIKCPKCGSVTNYSREGLDGMNGEGQHCDQCKTFVFLSSGQLVWITEEALKALPEQIQRSVTKHFKETGQMGKFLRF